MPKRPLEKNRLRQEVLYEGVYGYAIAGQAAILAINACTTVRGLIKL